MGIEVVTIIAGGGSYSAFLNVNVKAAFNEAARSFEFEVAAELGASATNRIFAVGTEVTISANGDLLLTGFVDAKEPSFAAKRAIISVSGRSKSGDLVDGSGEHETGRFENKTPLEIGQEISSRVRAEMGDRSAAEEDRAVPADAGRELLPLRRETGAPAGHDDHGHAGRQRQDHQGRQGPQRPA
jgi:prophage tail gpP-like protein